MERALMPMHQMVNVSGMKQLQSIRAASRMRCLKIALNHGSLTTQLLILKSEAKLF